MDNFILHDRLAVHGRGEEGHIVAVDSGEVFVVQPPEDAVRQPLHGGKVIVHSFLLSVKMAHRLVGHLALNFRQYGQNHGVALGGLVQVAG